MKSITISQGRKEVTDTIVSKKKPQGVITKWHGKGFGEAVYCSLFCHILNDNGIPSVFREHRSVTDLLDVPFMDWEKHHKDYLHWWWGYEHNDVPIMLQMVERAEKEFGVEIKIHKERNHVPVVFREMNVPKYDVVMTTITGAFSPYKKWPYFSELKELMKKVGISYLDLNQNHKYGIECLNFVKRARLYLGLDTGVAHYVSKFANGKALIINGGFVSFKYWAYLYDYEPIQIEDVDCRPCYKNWKHEEEGCGCPYDHRCMKEISPRMVFDRICERLA